METDDLKGPNDVIGIDCDLRGATLVVTKKSTSKDAKGIKPPIHE